MDRPQEKTSAYGFVVAAICFLVFFCGTYAQYQLSPMAGQVMESLSIDPQQYALLFTACMFPALVLSLLAGALCDRFGAKVTVGVAVALSTFGIVGRVFATSFPVMLACMVVLGLGCMILTSTTAKILAPHFAGEKLGVAVGIVSAASTVAMFIALATTALFPSLNAAYVFAAILAVVTLAAWLVGVRKDAPNVGAENPEAVSMGSALGVCLKTPYIWCSGTTLLFLMVGQIIIASFLPQALQAVKGFSEANAGAITSVYMLGAILGSMAGPKVFQMVSNKRIFASCAIVIVALGVAFAWQIPNFVAMCAVLFVCGAALSMFVPLLYAFPISLPEIGPRYAGAAGGLSATIQIIGATIVPTYILVPLFSGADGINFTALFVAAGCVVALALITVNMLPIVRKSIDAAQPSEPQPQMVEDATSTASA